jgi:hypothetical protein
MIEKKTGIQIFREVYDNVLESNLKTKKWISKDSLIKFIQECMNKVEDEYGNYRGVYFDDDKFLKELEKENSELEEIEEENSKFDEYNINIENMHQ